MNIDIQNIKGIIDEVFEINESNNRMQEREKSNKKSLVDEIIDEVNQTKF